MKKLTLNRLAYFAIASSLIGVTNQVFAGGFMLNEQNAVQTGDFGAGGAAIAEDASTSFFNPAGLIRIEHPQIVAAMNMIQFSTNFSGNALYKNSTPGFGTAGVSQNSSNVGGGTFNWVPSFHIAYPINPKIVAAFSQSIPFGLSTNYNGTDSYIRYAASSTQLETIDLSPSLGIKLTEKFSVGLGVDLQRLIANFSSYANLNPVAFSNFDTQSYSKASDWGYGWHGGALWQTTEKTRIGIAYRSQVVHHAQGYSLFTGQLASSAGDNPNGQFYSGHAKANVTLPANTTLSVYHDFNNRWAVMGSIVYTQWKSFRNLCLQNIVSAEQGTGDALFIPHTMNVDVPQNFRNTWRASVGTNYKVNQQWLVRAGIGFDQTPTNSTDRNLRLPDGNRYAVAGGAHYQITKLVGLDGGWTHEFIRSAPVHNTSVAGPQSVVVNGTSKSSADIVGLQLTWNFT